MSIFRSRDSATQGAARTRSNDRAEGTPRPSKSWGLYDGRNLKINLSQTLEERLAQIVREAEAEEWLAANRKAIDAYNARVERDGVWSDKLRSF